ncbi:sensor histidine kinase [Aeromicrobium sp. CF3.5]|uniref:sensor histidine kinase n=1 Tax=Aeromicrobium sp. CF3.5 TaxID=3373078 RepID=UPI003EE4859E
MPGPTKFRHYTKLTMQGAVAVAVAAISATGDGLGAWAVVGIVIAGIATIVALEAQPELAAWTNLRFRHWAIPTCTVVLTALWAVSAVVANIASSESDVDEARVVGLAAALLGTLSLIAFSRFTWWIVVAVSAATAVSFGAPAGTELRVFATALVLSAFVVATTLLTVWGVRIVDELEQAKDLGAELQLAEERLRFARDLHDVVGRNFSAIAVKSELAAALSRAGAGDRASAEMDDVKKLAVDSMAEMRQLVRGYRDIDLDSEVAGARSLLSAMGCDLIVEGDPDRVPLEVHELAAWVVREGTTNIVKHSTATSATLALGPAGMSLRNDGVVGPVRERSGLLGLAERLATSGARLQTTASDGSFVLEIHWENT